MNNPRVSLMRTDIRTFGMTVTAVDGWVWMDIRFCRYWVTLYLWKGNRAAN